MLSEGADHLTLIKQTLKNTFPNVNDAVSFSSDELNLLDSNLTLTASSITSKVDVALGTQTLTAGSVQVAKAPTSDNGVGNRAYNDARYANNATTNTALQSVTRLVDSNKAVRVQSLTSGAKVTGALNVTAGLTTTTGNFSNSITQSGGTAHLKATTVDSLNCNSTLNVNHGSLDVKAGNIHASGTISRGSDIRLKSEIKPLTDDITVDELYPVKYIKYGKPEMGFIAQEAAEVFPDLVTAHEETGILAMDYVQLIPVLVKEIQDLKAELHAIRGV